ncbi:MAG: galE 1 [Acidobacteria bacterium]|nr:galE 1 [Acidobacteriota bacterium]
MKVLITGAGGFVGKAIIERLTQDGFDLFELHHKAKKVSESDKNKENRVFYSDITSIDELLKLEIIGKCDVVVHAAGLAHQFGKIDNERFRLVNVKGTENVLELSKRLQTKHFVLIGSVSVYGDTKNRSGNKEGINEDAECAPVDAYAESKLKSEKIAEDFCLHTDMSLTILRLATVIGEEDRGNFLRLIKSIDARKFFWIGKGVNQKSLIHKEDVANAVSIVINAKNSLNENKEKNKKIEIFNVSAEPLSMKKIVDTIGGELNKKVPNISVNPKFLMPFFSFNKSFVNNKTVVKLEKTIEKWLAEDVFSNEKIKNEYNFQPQVSVETAIKREVTWYIEERAKLLRR